MSLQLFDSASRSVRTFTPIRPGQASIYLCGATVQGSPHIGHLRSGLAFDVLRRWLLASGYEVTFVRNVTDIDDKILAKSAQAGRRWWEWAYRFEREFTAAYDALGVLPPTYEPRATGYVGEMVALIGELIEAGHAYVGNPGNVYFDVPSFPQYGALTNQGGDDATQASEDGEGDKRDPRDFALWKAARPGEPADAAWDTPWGRGRPGWHLECSAMSRRFLGPEFDIHGGGIDLRFPHHENEMAQSRAAGDGSARFWLHNAWVTIAGEKMSKSLGNSLVVEQILRQHSAAVVRLALVSVHYRSTVEYSDETLARAATVWERLRGFVERAAEQDESVAAPLKGERVDDAAAPAAPTEQPGFGEAGAGEGAGAGAERASAVPFPQAFAAAMDDDLNVSAALAVVHERVREGNSALAAGDAASAARAAREVRVMLEVLGLDPLSEQWRGQAAATGATQSQPRERALMALVKSALEERLAARREKNWALADAVRDRLSAAGIVVEDSPSGPRWHVDEN
ncbi:cysteine--tRNA ligase [Buchananella felis]|uniref:cysteine--tRNA ligase n=1 Tax=Buchananella felis TaxID=3231492 RepID=UPI0035294C59